MHHRTAEEPSKIKTNIRLADGPNLVEKKFGLSADEHGHDAKKETLGRGLTAEEKLQKTVIRMISAGND